MASDHFAHVKLSCSSLSTSGLVFLMIVALCNFSRLRQAFDKMSHPHLQRKLQQYRIKGQLLKWISDFLTTRRWRRVVIDGHSCGWSEVTSGVPQGSILRPLLFLVYINELPLAVKCNCGLFAGDSILHRKVTSELIGKIIKLASIVPITCVTPGLLLWSLKSLRSYTYRDPRTLKLRANGVLGVELELLNSKINTVFLIETMIAKSDNNNLETHDMKWSKYKSN